MKVRAVVIPRPHTVELRELELIEPVSTDVIVRTAYSSISAGTERMVLAGQMPHPALSLPVVPGYETVGQIVGRGSEVPPEFEGRWVYVGGARCYQDINAAWGGQSAMLIVNYERVVPLETLEPRQGVLLALGATALHGVDLLEREQQLQGRRILVLGQGPVGQLATRIARARGAWVAVADKSVTRLERAEADQRILVQEQPVTEHLQVPVDMLIEATGSMAALTAALPALADGGTILLLGYYDMLQLPYMPLFLKQARLLTAREWAAGDLLRMRDLVIQGSVDVKGMLTHSLPVERIAEAYMVALDDLDCLKLVVSW